MNKYGKISKALLCACYACCACCACAASYDSSDDRTEDVYQSVASEVTYADAAAEEDISEQLKDGRISVYTGREKISHPYCYRTFSEKQKALYDKLASAMLECSERIEFSDGEKYTPDECIGMYELIYIYEYRLFYIEDHFEYYIGEEEYVESILPVYSVQPEEAEKMQAEIEEETDKILSGLSAGAGDYEIVKHIHDSIVLRCRYTEGSDHGDDVYGCLVRGEGICQAYSRAFAYLCAEAGITALTVEGVADELHMWDLAEMDGEFYHIDPTWDDPDREDLPDYISYDYFGIGDERIKELRQTDDPVFELPAANGSKYCYYSYNGLLAHDTAEAETILERELHAAAAEGRSVAGIMCADDIIYNEITERLFAEENIFEMLREVDPEYGADTHSVAYINDPDARTVKIILSFAD